MKKENTANDMISIIILNYNESFNNISLAIDSVLNQSYTNYEIIIADDCSKTFPKEQIEDKLSSSNCKYKIIHNKKNIGTVKNVINAINHTKGKYISFFASDDTLASKDVLFNYINTFNRKKADVVVSQWIMCNNEKKSRKRYIPLHKMFLYNLSKKYLIKDILMLNRVGIGAVAFKNNVLKENVLDTNFLLLEDWPLMINLAKNNNKIVFISKNGLYHNEKGVSDISDITLNKKIFMKEILDTYYNYSLILMNNYNKFFQVKLLRYYESVTYMYAPHIDCKQYFNKLNSISHSNDLKYYWIIDRIRPHLLDKILIFLKCSKLVLFTILSSILLTFILINYISIDNRFLIIIYIIIYIIMYLLLSLSKNLIEIVRKSKK